MDGRDEHRRLTLFLILVVMALLATVYFLSGDKHSSFWAFARDVIPNVEAGAGGFLIAGYVFGRRHDPAGESSSPVAGALTAHEGIREVSISPWDIDWPGLLSRSKSLYVYARFLDHWASNYYSSLVAFFQTGGSMVVVLPDPGAPLALRIVAQQAPVLKQDDTREVQMRIARSEEKLRVAASEGSGVGPDDATYPLRIMFTQMMVNYSAYVFDGREAVLAPYAHAAHDTERPPSELIMLSDMPEVRACLDRDFRRLVQFSTSPAVAATDVAPTAVDAGGDA